MSGCWGFHEFIYMWALLWHSPATVVQTGHLYCQWTTGGLVLWLTVTSRHHRFCHFPLKAFGHSFLHMASRFSVGSEGSLHHSVYWAWQFWPSARLSGFCARFKRQRLTSDCNREPQSQMLSATVGKQQKSSVKCLKKKLSTNRLSDGSYTAAGIIKSWLYIDDAF